MFLVSRLNADRIFDCDSSDIERWNKLGREALEQTPEASRVNLRALILIELVIEGRSLACVIDIYI